MDPPTSFVAGLALGAVILIAFALIARWRLTAPRGKVQQANDLADHREYERNLAQQELIRRLEVERELAKEKLQFESQLAEYEKYASLEQLALGAAHEINNPLLGSMSHLELEGTHTSGDQRTEVRAVFIPPLRERKEDIMPLALDVMAHFGALRTELKKNFVGPTPGGSRADEGLSMAQQHP